MMPKEKFHENQANTIIKNLKKRQIEGYYCSSLDEARTKILEMIEADSEVAFGGSMTLQDSGIIEALHSRTDITLYDRAAASSPEEIGAIYRKAFSCDYYLMSTNAITMEGELINIDGNGNRVSALIFGPTNVIIICGMNKIVKDTAEGLSRARNIAAPPNCNRLSRKTPCSITGECEDCLSPDCICSQTVITRRSQTPNRIKVILVDEVLGY